VASRPDLTRLSATAARRMIAEGKLTSTRVVEACLERIAERDPIVRAWQFIDRDLVLLQARERDSSAANGLLHGVPVALKDIIATEDLPTQYGSPIYRGHRTGYDAVCVAMMRAAGAVILGKTVTTEFATFSPGVTRHPHAPAHTPGGSSSGSAAAVADWQVPVATGTQTAGSIIRPAAFCGVIGYKPTFGRFSYRGIKVTAPSLDTLGLFVNDFDDLHLFSGVLTGLGAPTSSPNAGRAPRVGVCRTPWWERGSDDMHRVFEDTARRLAAAGATTIDISLPPYFNDVLRAQEIVMEHEMAVWLRPEYERYPNQLTIGLRRALDRGASYTVDQIQDAIALGVRCRAHIESLFASVDVLMAPTALGTAPATHSTTGDPIFERMWTMTGHPCVSYRSGSGENGLPIGVQAVGAIGADDSLIDYAAWMGSHTRELNP
jgi:Asp-tRNA(Asn)/Glu-tRNA(Gln) amidotransferase A subunit family amidase